MKAATTSDLDSAASNVDGWVRETGSADICGFTKSECQCLYRLLILVLQKYLKALSKLGNQESTHWR